MIDDLIVYFMREDWFRVVVNASTADKDIAWMRQVAVERRFSVRITPRADLAIIAVQGPNARAKFWQARPSTRDATEKLGAFFAAETGDLFVARTGYTGEDGFEIILPAQNAAQLWSDLKAVGVAEAGLGARDTLRLEAGMNLYGNDMDEVVSPLDAGLAWTVDLKGGARLHRPRRAGARWRAHGIGRIEAARPRRPAFASKVVTAAGEGEVTSGTFSPTLQTSIAMARVPRDVKVGDTVQVDVRGKLLSAQVVKMPFVRNGKALI